MARTMRSVGALIVLVGLLGGVPLLLAGTIGNPLDAWPDLRVGDLNDVVVIDLISVVVWVAWGQFAVSVLAEIAAVARQMPRSLHVPLVPQFDRHLAHVLVASVLLLVTTTGTLLGSSAVASAPSSPSAEHARVPVRIVETGIDSTDQAVGHRSPEAANAQAETHEAEASTTYVVPSDGAGPDTFWDIAEAYLGHGREWKAVWDLNQGRSQADGTVMSDPGLLRPGWTVLLPSDKRSDVASGAKEIVVEPDDSLSSIAAEHGLTDWRPVWKASRGMVEPTDERFTDPDQIRPGWTVRVPRDTNHSSTKTQPRDGGPTSPPAQAPRKAEQAPVVRIPNPSLFPKPSEPAPRRSEAPTESRPKPTRSETPHDVDRVDGRSEQSHRRMTAFVGGGVLLAGLLLGALLRHRRRQFRWRTPGRSIRTAPVDLLGVERQVRTAGGAGMDDVTWLNEALRSLGDAVADLGQRPPDVVAACLTATGLELHLTAPTQNAPEPWHASEDATRWTVRRDDLPVSNSGVARDHRFALYPALVSVGYTEQGDYWLLDLERVGAISLVGDAERSLNLARFMAAELAHNTWSEMMQVTMVGFGDELVAMNPDRLATSSNLDDSTKSIQRQLDAVHQVMDDANTDVLTGRLHNVLGDTWATHVLLVAPQAEGRDSVGDLLSSMRERGSRAAVAVVHASDGDYAAKTRWQVLVGNDGHMRIPALNLELIAHQLPESEAADLALLLTRASALDDLPMPAADITQPLSAIADAAGGLLAAGLAGGSAEARDSLGGGQITDPDSARGNDTAHPSANPLRSVVEAADPRLNADLADWRDVECSRPRVRLLGPIVVTAHGELPSQSPRLAWNTEVVSYLVTHPGGVSAERFGTDLWPDDPHIAGKTKVRQAIMTARRWLGTDPHGVEYLPKGTTSVSSGGMARYEVVDALVDADLFRRLRVRGTARGADGIDDLWTALGLVRGAPFDERRPGGYGWLADEAMDHIYAAMIADTAHTVATHHLDANEPEQAAAAARIAVLAGSSEDTPLLDLLRASDAMGTAAESNALVRRILNNHDAEVEEDLPPRTYQVFARRAQNLPAASDG